LQVEVVTALIKQVAKKQMANLKWFLLAKIS